MEKVYKIGKSNIEGKGLIAIKDLVAGDLVGMSHSGGQPSSEIGQYYNHSDSPNAVSQLVGDDRYVIASFPIKKGEEIVLDYRKQPDLEQPEDFINKAQDGGDPDTSETNNSFLYNLEKSVNRSLGNVNKRAQDFSESEDEMANIDNMRHAMGSRYAAEAIEQKVSDIPYIGGILNFTGADKMAGFIGSNALGIGHELRTMTDGDDRPFFTKLQESGEDVFNNFVGSTIGSTNMTSEKKDEIIRYLSHNNLLPDGYVQSDEDFSDDVYFRNADGSKRQFGGSVVKNLINASKNAKLLQPRITIPKGFTPKKAWDSNNFNNTLKLDVPTRQRDLLTELVVNKKADLTGSNINEMYPYGLFHGSPHIFDAPAIDDISKLSKSQKEYSDKINIPAFYATADPEYAAIYTTWLPKGGNKITNDPTKTIDPSKLHTNRAKTIQNVMNFGTNTQLYNFRLSDDAKVKTISGSDISSLSLKDRKKYIKDGYDALLGRGGLGGNSEVIVLNEKKIEGFKRMSPSEYNFQNYALEPKQNIRSTDNYAIDQGNIVGSIPGDFYEKATTEQFKQYFKDNNFPFPSTVDYSKLSVGTPRFTGVNEIDNLFNPEVINKYLKEKNVTDKRAYGKYFYKDGGKAELSKAQDGKEVKGYFTSYLNSDLFKRRAIDLYGEDEWENVRDKKLKRLEDTEVDFSGEEEWAEIYARDYSEDANIFTMMNLEKKFDRLQSRYMRPGYDGNLNPIAKVNPGQAVTMAEDNELSYNPFNSILANEYSHALGANHPNTNDTAAMDFLMTERERDMTREKGRDFLWSDNNLQIPHDTKSFEIKSDIDTTRYELWKAGLYNFEEDFMFNQSHIDYIKENPDKFIKDKQLLEQFDDNQIIDMMNTFTDNSSMPVGMSKYGGSLPKAQLGKFLKFQKPKLNIPSLLPKPAVTTIPFQKRLTFDQTGQVIPQQHMVNVGRGPAGIDDAINDITSGTPMWFAPTGDTRYLDRSSVRQLNPDFSINKKGNAVMEDFVPGLGQPITFANHGISGNTGKMGINEYPMTELEKKYLMNKGYHNKTVTDKDGNLIFVPDYDSPILRQERIYMPGHQGKIEGVFAPDIKFKIFDDTDLSRLGHAMHIAWTPEDFQPIIDEGYDAIQLTRQGTQLENILLNPDKFKFTHINEMPVTYDIPPFKIGGEIPKAQFGKFMKWGFGTPTAKSKLIQPSRNYASVAPKITKLKNEHTFNYPGQTGFRAFFPETDYGKTFEGMNSRVGNFIEPGMYGIDEPIKLMDGNTRFWLGEQKGKDWDAWYRDWQSNNQSMFPEIAEKNLILNREKGIWEPNPSAPKSWATDIPNFLPPNYFTDPLVKQSYINSGAYDAKNKSLIADQINYGSSLDKTGFDASTLINQNINLLDAGLNSNRSIVQFPMPDGKTQFFMRSSGSGNKDFRGLGSSEGVWSPFPGFHTTLNGGTAIDNWFVKGNQNQYDNFYGSQSYEDISKKLSELEITNKWDMSNQGFKSLVTATNPNGLPSLATPAELKIFRETPGNEGLNIGQGKIDRSLLDTQQQGGELLKAQFGVSKIFKGKPRTKSGIITNIADDINLYSYNRALDAFGNTGSMLSGSIHMPLDYSKSLINFNQLQNTSEYDPATRFLMNEYTIESTPFKVSDTYEASSLLGPDGNPYRITDDALGLALSNKIQGNNVIWKNATNQEQPINLTRNFNLGENTLTGVHGDINQLRELYKSGNPYQLGTITSWGIGKSGLQQFGNDRYVIKDFDKDYPALLNEYKGLTNNQGKVWKERELLLDNPAFTVANLIENAPRLPDWRITTSPKTILKSSDKSKKDWKIGEDMWENTGDGSIITKFSPFNKYLFGKENPYYRSLQDISRTDPNFSIKAIPNYGTDIELKIVKKKGGEMKKKSKYQISPFNKSKQVLTDPSKLLDKMIKQGVFTTEFKMGGEQSIGNGFTVKKEFDKIKNIPYVTYMGNPDIEGRVYYDSDSNEEMDNFNIINVESELLKKQKKHKRTKDIILKYRNGEELTHTERSHLNSLGLLD